MIDLANSDLLACQLLKIVQDLRFDLVEDSQQEYQALNRMPSIDLALSVFLPNQTQLCANVLFNHLHPEGVIAKFDSQSGQVSNIHYLWDEKNSDGDSYLWSPKAQWDLSTLRPIHAFVQPIDHTKKIPFVSPYPASLIKIIPLVFVLRLWSEDKIHLHDLYAHNSQCKSIYRWLFEMTTVSCNKATEAMTALLHQHQLLNTSHQHPVNQLLLEHGLNNLQYNHTLPSGQWTNACGAGVGSLNMSAWDTVRLLWLLDETAPEGFWQAKHSNALGLNSEALAMFYHLLKEQALHEVLSSTLIAGLEHTPVGIPARMSASWINQTDQVRLGEEVFPKGVLEAQYLAELEFAHKTGSTENYTANAGIVKNLTHASQERHYIIAFTSNLGVRYAYPVHPLRIAHPKIHQLGHKIDQLVVQTLQSFSTQ